MSNLNEIYQSDAFDSVRGLEQDRAAIEQALEAGDFASDIVRMGYEAAHSELLARIEAAATQPELQDAVAAAGELTYQEEAELAPLEAYLPGEKLADLRAIIESKRAGVAQYFDHYGVKTEAAKSYYDKVSAGASTVSASVNVVEVAPPTVEPAQETDKTSEKEPRHVHVRIGENSVGIGKRGRIVPYVSRNREHERDYTILRKNALLCILTREGEEISPHQLWEFCTKNTELEGQPFNGYAMSPIRSWLTEKLTHGYSPIVMTNRKRGLASRYFTNPELSLELVFDQRLTAVAEGADKNLTPKAQAIIVEKDKDPGANYGDLFIAAGRLASFNKLLAAHGIAEVTEEMCEQLSRHRPDWSEFKNNDRAIAAQRTAAIERVKALFLDEERLFDFLDKNETAFDYAFVDFIANLESSDRELVDRLFRAERRTEDVIVRGQVIGQRFKVYDENENEILPPTAGPDFWYTTFPGDDRPPQPEPARRSTGRRSRPKAAPEPQPEPEPEPEPVPQPEPEVAADSGADKKAENGKFQLLTDCVDEVVRFFLENNGSINETYGHGQLRQLVPSGFRSVFTKTNLIKIYGDNHAARNMFSTHKFDLREILTVAVHNHTKFRPFVKKYSSEIDSYIDRVVAELAAT